MSQLEHNTFSVEEDLSLLFRHASRLMARKFHHHHFRRPHAQRHIYSLIREHGGAMAQKELMEHLGVRSASLSEILSKMERQGVVTRQRNEQDKRGFIVSISEDNLLETEGHERVKETLFSCLNESEQKQLADLLTKIIDEAEKGQSHHKGRFGFRKQRMKRK